MNTGFRSIRIYFERFLVTLFASTSSMAVKVIVSYGPESLKDIPSMVALSPLGWLLLGWIGPIWITILGLVLAIRRSERRWHGLSALGGLVLGFIWPYTFYAAMSV